MKTVTELEDEKIIDAKRTYEDYIEYHSNLRIGTQEKNIKLVLSELNYNFSKHNNPISNQIIELSKKYEIQLDKLPNRNGFLDEFSKLYSIYSWNETSLRLFEKYGLELDDINFYMNNYPYRDQFYYSSSFSSNRYSDLFFEVYKESKEVRLASKKAPKIFLEICKFNNSEEFLNFINLREMVDYFSDKDEAIISEFVKLFLKINEVIPRVRLLIKIKKLKLLVEEQNK